MKQPGSGPRAKEAERVLFVCTQMEAAGVQVIATAMAKTLLGENVAAEVVFLYRKRGAFDDVAFARSMLPTRPRSVFDLARVFVRLLREVRRFRPTAIVGFAHYSSPIATVAGMLCGVDKRVGTQTSPPTSYGRMGRVLDWICGSVGVYTANIAASRAIEAQLAGYPACYRQRLVTVHNGVRAHFSGLTRLQARRKFALPASAFVVANVGRLAEEKNQRLVINAIAKSRDAHLVIAGEGELRGELEREISALGMDGRVTLLGEIAPQDVGDLFRAADVFAFPSLYEAFGLAVVEAMLAGLPVISSNHSALSEVIGDAGVLLSPADAKAWTEQIERLQSNNDLRNILSARAVDRAQMFSFDAMLAGFRRHWQ